MLKVDDNRAGNANRINAFMLPKTLVFDGQQGVYEIFGDVVKRDQFAFFNKKFADDFLISVIHLRDQTGAKIFQTVNVRQFRIKAV